MGDALIRERHGAVERIILNRAAQDNMLNDAFRTEMLRACDEITRDTDIHVVILTGCDGIFSRSSDWVEQNAKGYMESEEAFRGFLWNVRDVSIRMRSVPKPIIAAVNGVATMGGFELALSCDFIVASSAATMGDGHVSGVGGGGGSQRLMELIGARATRWMLYTGEVLSAERAYELGIVQQVYPSEKFDESVLELAKEIATRRLGRSLERIKALTAGSEPSLSSLNYEIDHSIAHWLSREASAWRADFSASGGNSGK